MLEDIRSRIDPLPDFAVLSSNVFQLWFDCRYLLSEVDYYKQLSKALETELEELKNSNWNSLSIADRDSLIRDAIK